MKELRKFLLIAAAILINSKKINSIADICEFHPNGARIPYLEGNCSSFAVCAFGQIAYISECAKGLHFNRRSSECDLPSRAECEKYDESVPNNCELCDCELCCFDQNKCPDDKSRICEGQNDDTKIHVKGECREYIVCEGECPTKYQCEGDFYFNPKTKKCDLPGVCIRNENGTTLPVKKDCSKYIICEKECPIQAECPNGLYFNRETGVCDLYEDPCSPTTPPPPATGPSGLECPANGKCFDQNDNVKFAHPTSVYQYIECFCHCDLYRWCAPGSKFNEDYGLCV